MAYEVTAAEDAPQERLVVSVGGKTLVFGEALEEDRDAEGVIVVADEPVEGDADLASELALISERVPEVAAAVQVEYVGEPEPEDEVLVEVVEVTAYDEADTVVPAGETTPDIERELDLDDDGSAE